MNDANNVDHPLEVIGQGRQAELGSDFLQAIHQEMTLVPPMLDGAKGVFDNLFTLFHHLRVGGQPLLSLFDDLFVHPAGNATALLVAGTFFFQGTI